MDIILIIAFIAIINAVIKTSKQKKAREQAEAQRAAQRAAAQQEPAQPQHTAPAQQPSQSKPAYGQPAEDPRFPAYTPPPPRRKPDPRFPEWEGDDEAAQREPAQRELAQRELAQRKQRAAEASARADELARKRAELQRQRQPTSSQPRIQSRIEDAYQSSVAPTQDQRHTLEPSFLSGHAHEETSLQGRARECPPQKQDDSLHVTRPARSAVPSARSLGRMMQNRDALAQGMVLSEILGKPKALRR